ncbi:MAG: glutamine amidotransferase [Spirochaetae bacterium HGW-Spirochaetae-1]|jgi:putative intracellular protease/amidase|nr:MAG: glutamine amidotransferase [Spirochaetae bacterium HGW-Spirochaetae-1]
MEKQTGHKNCYLYVLNTLADWEIGFITAELKSRRFIPENTKIELLMVGNTLQSITTMGGISISPEISVEDIEFKEGDILVLPGADTWLEEENKKILDMVPDLLQKKVIIAAICGATAALAQRGLLNNRKHTSNDKEYLKMFCPAYEGILSYIDAPVAVDENLITATGLAPLEFAYELFKKSKAMRDETLEAWYQLYRTKEAKYFFNLMESLK